MVKEKLHTQQHQIHYQSLQLQKQWQHINTYKQQHHQQEQQQRVRILYSWRISCAILSDMFVSVRVELMETPPPFFTYVDTNVRVYEQNQA